MSAYKDALNKITSGKSSSNTQKSSSSKSGGSSSAYKKALSKYYTPSNTNTKQQTSLPLSERKIQAKEATNNSSSLNQSYVQKYYGMNREKLLKEYDRLSNNPKSANEAAWVKNLADSYDKMSEQDYVHEVGNIQRQIDRAKQKGKKNVKEEGAPAATVFGDESYREYLEQDKINSLENQLNEKDSNGRSLLDNLYFKRGDNKYGNLESNDDFEVLSSTIDNNRAFGIQVGENFYGLGDNVYRYINKLGPYSDAANPSRHQADTGTEALLQKYDYMLPKEKDNYNYIYQTEGKDAANEYLEYLSYELNNRRINGVGFSNNDIQKYSGIKNTEGKLAADEYLKLLGDSRGYNLSADRLKGIKGENAENAGEGFWGAADSSLKSVGTNLVSGLGILDIAGQNLGRTLSGEYKPIDYNSAGMSANAATTAIRGTVTNNLRDKGEIKIDEESHPIAYKLFNGKSWGDVYQLGMSMADSAAIAALSPIIGDFGTYLLGGAAGTQGMLDALERGANDEQAITLGLLNGAFEAMFEKVSLENLMNMGAGNFWKQLAKQGFVEGSEEVSTSIFNNLADTIVMAEKSVMAQDVKAYEDKGYSYVDAYWQTFWDRAIDIGWDFIGGAITGGIMGGTTTGIQNAVQNNFDNRYINSYYDNSGFSSSYDANYQKFVNEYISNGIDEETAQAMAHRSAVKAAKAETKNNPRAALNKDNEFLNALVDESLEINPDNKLAKKIQSRLNEGKNTKSGQLRRLTARNEQNMRSNDIETIKSAASQRLTELGETSNIQALSDIIAKQTAGETLSGIENQFLASSKYGMRVVNELNPENVRSGEYSSEWVQDINTDRINADEYSRALTAANAEAIPSPSSGTALPSTANRTPAYNNAPINNVAPALEQNIAEPTIINAKTDKQSAIDYAYNVGKGAGQLSDILNIPETSVLTEDEIKSAYESGRAASNQTAADRKNNIQPNGKKGFKRGSVTAMDGITADSLSKTLNDPQKKAYGVLSAVSGLTGIDIVLIDSKAGANGRFTDAQGKFSWKDNKIYIDINSGLWDTSDINELSKYTMLRTFTHEFVHFIEKFSPDMYNELRDVVFDELRKQGVDTHSRIEEIQAMTGSKNYDWASRELVAESLTDILPDSTFVKTLANEHKSLFDKLVEKLKDFLDEIKAIYKEYVKNPSPEAEKLKQQTEAGIKYVQRVIDAFDKAALNAVENYQAAFAVDVEVAPAKAEVKSETKTEEQPAAVAEETVEEMHEVGEDVGPTKTQAKPAPKTSQEWQDRANSGEVMNITDLYNIVKEENSNGETQVSDNNEGISEPNVRGEGPSRLLEGEQSGAVQSVGEGRNPSADTSAEGRRNVRGDVDSDTASGDESTSSARDSVGGHIQQLESGAGERGQGNNVPERIQGESKNDGAGRTGGVDRQDVNDTSAEKLQEEVETAVSQKSTVSPKGSNFVIGDSLNLPNGEKARIRANIEAIKIAKQLEAEGRYATPEEQEILSKFVGWGALDKAFGEPKTNYQLHKVEYVAKTGYEDVFNELREVIPDNDEYDSARRSTKNAHYTSIDVVKGMYAGLKQLGFTGGRMLEPSCGAGNFVGAMPTDMTNTVKSWTMVELDHVTGLVAKYLYPNADMRIQGFEDANIPDGYMDVAIGNVPFDESVKVPDKRYPNYTRSSLHNYFFVKSLDKVRTGGIVMFITSHFTLDSKDSRVREYIMSRADMLGAIRLPNTAFWGNAGTKVTTDIIILKKRAFNTEYAGEAFQSVNPTVVASETQYGGYTFINEYFINHPEMVLGTQKIAKNGMYGASEYTVDAFENSDLRQQIVDAFKNVKGKMDYSTPVSPEAASLKQATQKKKNQRLKSKDGKVFSVDEEGNEVSLDLDEKTAKRMTGIVEIRDVATALVDAMQQGASDESITSLRNKLNTVYDSFVKKYKELNSIQNKKLLKQFSDSYFLLSLENYDKDSKVTTKSDIFFNNTIVANKTPTRASNISEGVTISVNTTGKIDVPLISKLIGQKADVVTRQIIDERLGFKDKDGNLIPAEMYLSGNVRAKLREAEALVGIDPDYNNNIEALKNVLPPFISHSDIFVNPGANWISTDLYEEFIAHILQRRNYIKWDGSKNIQVDYASASNEYKINLIDKYAATSSQNRQEWGDSGVPFHKIFENLLNGRKTNVYTGPSNARVLDIEKTQSVAVKAEAIADEFRKWLWEDSERTKALEYEYNEIFNALVAPKFSGDSLTVNGLNPTYYGKDGKPLYPHQRDAVARIVNSGGNTLLAHRVGAGKTLEMATAAMKLKQLGVIKKPMFVVPNNVVAQWGNEFRDYYPGAKILVVGDKDMTPAERMTTINKIKNNDYDAVILAYTKFEKIPMTKEWRKQFYQEMIDESLFAINEEREITKGKSMTVKALEKLKSRLENKIKQLESVQDDEGAMFEDLGIDSLFVDEAHNFKNLEFTSRMRNVAGIGNPEGSKRSFDLLTKIRYLQQMNGGRGIVFATATPVMNSMTEMYSMQKYLQPDTLRQLNIYNFDAWAKMYGEVVNDLEVKPSGVGYRVKQSFSRFKNLKSLQQLFSSFTDVLTDVPGLKIPKMKTGKVISIECPQSEFQTNYMKQLAQRADNIKGVDPRVDNMLKITSDGRKIAYSQRMIDPSLPYEPKSKIMKCCDKVFEVYQESTPDKGVQMIFCDMATPKGESTSKKDNKSESENTEEETDLESAKLYEDMKARLIELGIPANEIAFIHDAKNDAQKEKLSRKLNSGEIRVVIGSTGKMGVGLNAQKRAIAIHHLDAPWRPGDIEQRDGRVFRQKNMFDEVYKFVYLSVPTDNDAGSFDARLWNILERKQNFINQVMNGDDVGNEIEDSGQVTVSAAEMKALSSGNPLILEQVALEKQLSALNAQKRSYDSNVLKAKSKIESDTSKIARLENTIANLKSDIANRKDTYSSDSVFSITIGNQTYTNKKDAGAALLAVAKSKAVLDKYTKIGSFAGFDMLIKDTPADGLVGIFAGKNNYEFRTYVLAPTAGINHLISIFTGLEEQLEYNKTELTETKRDLESQKKLATQPFEKADELAQKRARYNEVMYELNPPKEEQQIDDSMDDDTVQEESREYLNPEREKAIDAALNNSHATGGQKSVTIGPNNTRIIYGSMWRKEFTREQKALYKKAKTNDDAAFDLMDSFITKEFASALVDNFGDAIFAPVVGREDVSDNILPHVFASYLNSMYDLPIYDGIIKTNRVGMTVTKDIGEKLLKNVTYDFDIGASAADIKGKRFVVIDDMMTTGVTAFSMARFITEHGGKVVGFASIARGGRFNTMHMGATVEQKNTLESMGTINYDRKFVRKETQWISNNAAEYFIRNQDLWNRYLEQRRSASNGAVNSSEVAVSNRTWNEAQEEVSDTNSELFPDDGIQYIPEQNQLRSQSYTDREVLEVAAENVDEANLTESEKNSLNIFKQRISKLNQLTEQRTEAGRLYKEQQFGANVDRVEAEKTLNRMRTLDSMIKKADAELLKVEETEVLKKVLQKGRSFIEQNERQRGRENLQRWRERRYNAEAVKKYRTRIESDVGDLQDWILHPSNKDITKHIPDALKNSVVPFLNSINFASKRQLRGGDATKADKALVERLKAVNDALKQNQDIQGMYSGYNDLPEDFMDNLQKFIYVTQDLINKNSGEYVINKMSAAELKQLSDVVRILKKYIKNMNVFHNNAMFQHVYEAGDSTIDSLAGMTQDKNTGMLSNYLFWQQMRPAYAFERFGNGGKAVYDELRRGQDKLAFNAKAITEFTEGAYTDKEVKAWTNDVHSITLDGDEVRMTTAQIMSLYLLSKRANAKTHLYGSGIRVASYKTNKSGLRTEMITDIGHKLTPQDVSRIISELTPRQLYVADKLQQYMAKQGGEWGNYVSMVRFGENTFTEDDYFPMNSDGRHLPATTEEAPSEASLYALLNMSFTKELTPNANNRLIVYSVFDVFAAHMASMAQYNAFALPILDALKWFNYKQYQYYDDGSKEMLGSVRDELARVYGTPEETRPGSGRQGYAENFIMRVIQGFNSTETQGIPEDTFAIQTLHRFNKSRVAFNLSTALKQPLAIVRAASLLDGGSIIRGLSLDPDTVKANIAEMQKYSGIAVWKSLGYFDINISRGLTSVIKHDETTADKITDVGMKGAEFMDTITWAAMWSAAREEVSRKFPNLKYGTTDYFDKVTEVFESVIYKTQVVDSVLTKSQFMRSKGGIARITSSFMAEPVATVSMVLDAFDKYNRDTQKGFSASQAWNMNKGKIARTMFVYALSQAIIAAVSGVVGAWRDDDEYETAAEKFKEHFIQNLWKELNPIGMIPVISDIGEALKELAMQSSRLKEIAGNLGMETYSYDQNNILIQWSSALIKAAKIADERAKGDSNYTSWAVIYKLLDAASGATGLPVATPSREIVDLWNNTVGARAPTLKIRDYVNEPKYNIKTAFDSGYLTADEAMKELVDSEVVKDEDAAYWQIQRWSYDGEGTYSEYDNLNAALETGTDVQSAVDELTTHGYTEKKVRDHVENYVKKLLLGDDKTDASINSEQALKMLNESGLFEKDKAESMVIKWTYKDTFDLDESGQISQLELAVGISDMPRSEAEKVWDAYGFKTTYDEYISNPKNAASVDLEKNHVEYDEKTWKQGLDNPNLQDTTKDSLVAAYGTYMYDTYNALRETGMSADEAYEAFDEIDTDDNDSAKQVEVIIYLVNNFSEEDAEYYWDAICAAKGWTENGKPRTYASAKKRNKKAIAAAKSGK